MKNTALKKAATTKWTSICTERQELPWRTSLGIKHCNVVNSVVIKTLIKCSNAALRSRCETSMKANSKQIVQLSQRNVAKHQSWNSCCVLKNYIASCILNIYIKNILPATSGCKTCCVILSLVMCHHCRWCFSTNSATVFATCISTTGCDDVHMNVLCDSQSVLSLSHLIRM